jgi:hypothetical protein
MKDAIRRRNYLRSQIELSVLHARQHVEWHRNDFSFLRDQKKCDCELRK